MYNTDQTIQTTKRIQKALGLPTRNDAMKNVEPMMLFRSFGRRERIAILALI
jgi:hypothetical protein